MKIRITLKDPDGVSNSVDRCIENLRGITDDDLERQREDIEDSIKGFVEYNEYVTIEIDTDTNTAIVIPVK